MRAVDGLERNADRPIAEMTACTRPGMELGGARPVVRSSKVAAAAAAQLLSGYHPAAQQVLHRAWCPSLRDLLAVLLAYCDVQGKVQSV